MNNSTEQLIAFLRKNDGINDKAKLAKLVSDNFHLTKDELLPLVRRLTKLLAMGLSSFLPLRSKDRQS